MAVVEKVSGIVIAGGRSRRLGHDKRHLRLWGESGPTLLRHTVDILAALCAEVIVVLNDPEQWSDLPARLIGDAYPDAGALGGLATGLAAAQYPYALAVASDMPLLNTTLLQAMLALPRDYDALVAQVEDRETGRPGDRETRDTRHETQEPPAGKRTRNALSVEPLHAIYSRACLGPIEQCIAAGRYQIVGFFDAVQVRYLDPQLIAAHDPARHSFLSINTPEQLDAIKTLISGKH